MTSGPLHKICAHPVIVTWVLGACTLNTVVVVSLARAASLSALAADWQEISYLMLALISSSGLGFYLGMFTCWPLIRIICCKINGAPLTPGDQVLVLSGPRKGKLAPVYELTTGQGGWQVVRLDLGPECPDRHRDIFEEYSVLKIKKANPKMRPMAASRSEAEIASRRS